MISGWIYHHFYRFSLLLFLKCWLTAQCQGFSLSVWIISRGNVNNFKTIKMKRRYRSIRHITELGSWSHWSVCLHATCTQYIKLALRTPHHQYLSNDVHGISVCLQFVEYTYHCEWWIMHLLMTSFQETIEWNINFPGWFSYPHTWIRATERTRYLKYWNTCTCLDFLAGSHAIFRRIFTLISKYCMKYCMKYCLQ